MCTPTGKRGTFCLYSHINFSAVDIINRAYGSVWNLVLRPFDGKCNNISYFDDFIVMAVGFTCFYVNMQIPEFYDELGMRPNKL